MKEIRNGLYLVALPIGNLGDMSFRAVETLRQVDEIWAEDTRNIRKLLHIFEIDKSKHALTACHDHNEREMSGILVQKLKEGRRVAYVSDAGMPVISDPGFRLVRAVQEAGEYVTVVPGANAAVSALAISGLPSDQFVFLGFVPTKSSKRAQFLEKIRDLNMTAIAYESPRRVHATLKEAAHIFGSEVETAIVREITKNFEEVIRGRLQEVNEAISEREIKGEVVLVFAPVALAETDDETLKEALMDAMTSMRMKSAVQVVADRYKVARNRVYDLALEIVKQE